MIFIDANIFLELFLNDQKADKCADLFMKLKEKSINGVTSDFIIYSCLLQIQQKLNSIIKMGNFILFINDLKGMDISRPSIKEIYDAIKISKKYRLDFDDSLVVSIMINNNIRELISFDKHFDKIPMIKRIEP